jgi:hypothetical protein
LPNGKRPTNASVRSGSRPHANNTPLATTARTATAREVPNVIVSLLLAIAVVLFLHSESANFSFSWYWHFVNTLIKMASAALGNIARRQEAASARLAWQRGATLLPVARRPAPFRTAVLFTDRIALAFELAGLRAAEVALPLKVIDEGGGVTPYEPIARAGHARGRIMAYGLGESWRPR